MGMISGEFKVNGQTILLLTVIEMPRAVAVPRDQVHTSPVGIRYEFIQVGSARDGIICGETTHIPKEGLVTLFRRIMDEIDDHIISQGKELNNKKEEIAIEA